MDPLERKALVHRYRREGGVPSSALAVEDAPRERAVRRLRAGLLEGRPILLQHVRWPALGWLVEGLEADLAIEPEPLVVRHTALGGIVDGADGWRAVPALVAETLGVDFEDTSAMSAASREGFKRRLMTVLKTAARVSDVRRVVFLSGADALGFEVIQDLCFAWRDASQRYRGVPLLVVARRVGGQSLQFDGALSVRLPDPSRTEAIRMLAELLGGSDRERLETVIDNVGTVPGFMLRVARAGGITSARGVARALGSMWRELVAAVDIVRGQEILAERLDALCTGPQPAQPLLDRPLLRAGLIARADRRGAPQVRLRSPLVALACGVEDGAVDTSQPVAAVKTPIRIKI